MNARINIHLTLTGALSETTPSTAIGCVTLNPMFTRLELVLTAYGRNVDDVPVESFDVAIQELFENHDMVLPLHSVAV